MRRYLVKLTRHFVPAWEGFASIIGLPVAKDATALESGISPLNVFVDHAESSDSTSCDAIGLGLIHKGMGTGVR